MTSRREPAPMPDSPTTELNDLRRELDALRRRNEKLTEEVATLKDDAGHAQRRIVELEAIVAGFETSTSWRATRPLRTVRAGAARIRAGRQFIKTIVRRPLLWMMGKGLASPNGRRLARRVLTRVPRLEARLRVVGENAGMIGQPPPAVGATRELSPRAQRIYKKMVSVAERTNA